MAKEEKFWKWVKGGAKEKILEILGDGKPHISGEIAKKTGIPRSIVNYHLHRLAVDGKVKREVLSPRVILWKIKRR